MYPKDYADRKKSYYIGFYFGKILKFGIVMAVISIFLSRILNG